MCSPFSTSNVGRESHSHKLDIVCIVEGNLLLIACTSNRNGLGHQNPPKKYQIIVLYIHKTSNIEKIPISISRVPRSFKSKRK